MRSATTILAFSALLSGCRSGFLFFGKGQVHDWSRPEDAEPVPFGFWGLNGFQDADGLEDLQDRFGITGFHTATRHPSYGVNELLPLVRDAGLHVNLRLTGDHEHYTDGDGDFDLAAWKRMVDEWKGSGVQEFIDDGTLAHHMLLDDLDAFPGRGPTGDELESMASYSKRILPGLATLVREEADDLPIPEAGFYVELDASINQYRARDGDVEDYTLDQMDAAGQLGVGLVMGINIANGGDGSSYQPGWAENFWAMSAEEIETYGYVLTGVPDMQAFYAWEYDGEEEWSDGSIGSDYFDEPELTEALLTLMRRARGSAAD